MARSAQNNWCKLAVAPLLGCIILFLVGFANAQKVEWYSKLKGIEILRSTRTDIEQQFPRSKVVDRVDFTKERNGWGQLTEYETDDGYLEVEYSTIGCPRDRFIAYKVPYDTVVEIRFYPHREIELRKFGFNLKEFESEAVDDVEDTKVLRSRKLGLKIVVVKNKLSSIEFMPTEMQSKLLCP